MKVTKNMRIAMFCVMAEMAPMLHRYADFILEPEVMVMFERGAREKLVEADPKKITLPATELEELLNAYKKIGKEIEEKQNANAKN